MRDQIYISASTGEILEELFFTFLHDHNLAHSTPKETAAAIQMFADNMSYELMDIYDIDPEDLVTEDILI